ncbi:MAG TPA: ATP-binding protein [Hyphomicrobium sp.]|nr:ATP-binding protein [Hyphomicrobium sp.]
MAWARDAVSALLGRIVPVRSDDAAARDKIDAISGIERLTDAHWQLTETETRFRDLLDNQAELIVRRDSKGRVMFANIAFCAAFGVDNDEIHGKSFQPDVIAWHRVTSERDRRISTVEQLETSRGQRWIQWDDHRVMTPDGDVEVQSVGRDVTEDRRREQELRDTRDQADAANRAKSRFLAAMSHEIRTPMNGILGMASLMQETEQSDEQKIYTNAIDHSAKALLALIDEILDFSKIEAGKLELAVAPFSLRDCIESALELMSPNAAHRGNRLVHTIADDVPHMMLGDAARVRQIILNLVSNAVKFTEHGDIDVIVRRAGHPAARAPIYEVIVKDTGIGLSKEAMALLFHEFEQADHVPEGRQCGTGLGLAISKRLARAMEGDICAEGAPGKGATFTVTVMLPDCRAETAGHTPLQAPASPDHSVTARDGSPPRILLAEDNDINALLARRMCERSGCIVVLAKNGREAVDAIAQSLMPLAREFDLILMDVFMPHMDGLEAARAIKRQYVAHAGSPRGCPPIIALTANAFPEDRDRCLAAGMDDYLAKPFDSTQLRALLHRWLQTTETRLVG